MSPNIFVKNSIIKRFVVAAYTLTAMILLVITFLYFNQYQLTNNSKTLAKTLNLLIINTNSQHEVQTLNERVIEDPENLEAHNLSLVKLKEVILKDLKVMEILEKQISNNNIINFTILYIQSIDSNKKNIQELSEELLTIRKTLRKIQLAYTLENKKKIESILNYDNTFTFIIYIFTFLTMIFSVYKLWIYTNLLNSSLNNLLRATEEINNQNYSYKAPVIGDNELSIVTDEFNKMTQQLGEQKNELLEWVESKNRLLSFTNLFSRALSEEEVYEIVFNHAFTFIGAFAGAAYILNHNADTLSLKKYSGEMEGPVNRWTDISSEEDLPIWDVIKLQKSIYVNSYVDEGLPGYQIYISPVIIESRPIGALLFVYTQEKKLSENEKNFLDSLTNSCANTIYRTKLYDNAKKAITVRDDFLSIASHELQTPLTPLKMQMQFYKSKLEKNDLGGITPEKWIQFLNNSITQIDKVSHLIDDLLNVSSINNGSLIVHKTFFKLNEFIEKILIIHSQFSKNTLQVIPYVLTPSDLEVNWDAYKIEQIMLNLFSNASKYANGSPVELKVESDRKCIWIYVRDYGPGIAKHDREKVFRKYERLVNQTNIRSLGLGLYISKEIAQLHNGNLKIIDTNGPGTTFCLSLPINNA